MLTKVSVDNSYLTIDITQEERKKIINNDPDAVKRANHFETEIDGFIKQVEYLHFVANLDANKIADFFLIPKTKNEISPPPLSHESLRVSKKKIYVNYFTNN